MSSARQAFVLVFVPVKGMRGEQEKYQSKTKNRLYWHIFKTHLISLRNGRCLVWFEGKFWELLQQLFGGFYMCPFFNI